MKNRNFYTTLLTPVGIILALIGASCSNGGTASNEGIVWQPDIYTAIKTSAQEDKSILLYLNADWCSYCRKMETETFTDSAVLKELGDAFLWVKLDGDKDPDGNRFKNKFSVRGYPAIFLLDSEENELDRLAGYLPPDRFLDMMISMRDGDTFAGLQERAGEDPEDLEAKQKLAEKLLTRGQPVDSLKNLEMVLKADPENEKGQMEPALYLMAQATYALRQYQPTLAVLDKYEEKFPDGAHLADFMLLRAQLNLENNDDESAKTTLEKFLEDYPEHPKAEIVRRHLSDN